MQKNIRLLALAIVILCVLVGLWFLLRVPPSPAPQPQPMAEVFHPDPRTKTFHCIIQGPLPDHACTPGAVFDNVAADQVCAEGYAGSVRNVPASEKKAVYAEYGIPTHQPYEYEVDHHISLELGGSNDIANLWPEAAVPAPGFHEKDRVENELHRRVCKGEITLAEAQKEISENWMSVYATLGY